MIRIITLTLFLLGTFPGFAQSLPIDFESSVTTEDFVDFDGGTATVLPNPQPGGINTSATVAQIVRNGGEVFAGSKIELAANLDFTTLNVISMKVFTTAPIGTTVKFKLEGNGAAERDVQTTKTNEWEEMRWDFTGTPANFNTLVFMFDFGNVGDGSATSTFLFDDVEQLFGGTQIDLPVTFEGDSVNYTLTDFNGNASSLVEDPEEAGNTVARVFKSATAGATAGTTIGTPAGFATNIPLTLTDGKMSARVWSPAAGTPIRLKVEDANDPTHTCETEVNTTLAGAWEILEFDFTNEAPGTATLMFGLSQGWTYNMASIFFNFGTDGAAAGDQIYYFDDVQFGEFVVSTTRPEIAGLRYFPNPATDHWNLVTDGENIEAVEIFDTQGRRVISHYPAGPSVRINAAALKPGLYVAKIVSRTARSTISLLKD